MLNKENTGLIVVDIQGRLARLVADNEKFVENCQALIRGVQLLGLPVVSVEQNPAKLGGTIEEIRGLLPEQPIEKFTFDACEAPEFIEAISNSGITSWLVCGIEAHICVYQTANHLQSLGYDIHLVSDCVSSRSLANKDLALSKLSRLGITMTGVEMCLYELVKDCRATEFKGILNLVK